jgi:hypothetical protein
MNFVEELSDLEILSAGIRVADELLEEVFRVHVDKALDPLNGRDFDVITAQLGAKLRASAMPTQARAVREALNSLDVDWPSLSPDAIDRIIDVARQKIVVAPNKVLPKIQQGFKTESVKIVGDTKKSTILKHKLDIQANFSLLDERVVAYSSHAPNLFVRDKFGQISEVFAGRARRIVAENLEQGFGRADIAAQLEKECGALGRQSGYWQRIAGIFTTSSRAWAQVSSYQEAGIIAYLWESIMDEATSVQCRFLHGQRFPVARALEIFSKLEAEPDDPKRIAPFLNVAKGEDGGEALVLNGSKALVARVVENKVGTKDDPGKFDKAMGADALAAAGVVSPPAHGECRSTTTPEFGTTTVNVPAQVQPAQQQAPAPQRAPRPPPPPKAPPPLPQSQPVPESAEAKHVLAGLEELESKDGQIDVATATPLKVPARGALRPYEAALARVGKSVDEIVETHGEKFTMQLVRDDLKKIQATEKTIDKKAIAEKANSMATDRAVLIKSEGKYFLHSGTEHVIACSLRDRGKLLREMNVALVDLDKLEKTDKPDTQKWADNLAKKLELSNPKEDGKAIREALREQLRGSLGLVTRDDRRGKHPGAYGWRSLPEAGKGFNGYSIEASARMAGANAWHDWAGAVGVRDSVHENAKKVLTELAKNPRIAIDELKTLSSSEISKKYDSVRTLLHEEAHGTSKLQREGYRGVGIGIEEAGTEILARKAARGLLGFTEHTQAFSLPTKKTYGRYTKYDVYDGGDGSYSNYIGGLFNKVAKHTGDAGIHDRIERAFIATRQWGNGDTYSTARDQVVDFVKKLRMSSGESLSTEAQIKLVDELLDPKGPFE